jgi:Ca2+-binding RTX toxin-like protein
VGPTINLQRVGTTTYRALTSVMIDGGPVADRIVASQIADTLLGGDGNDGFKIESFDDAIDAGMGRDRASIDLAGEVTASDDTTTFTGLEFLRVEGSDGNDIVHASGYSGRLWLRGRSGDDLLEGGSGRNSLDGGNGHDVLVGGVENDRLRGQDGDDSVDGGEGNDFLSDGFGADISWPDRGTTDLARSAVETTRSEADPDATSSASRPPPPRVSPINPSVTGTDEPTFPPSIEPSSGWDPSRRERSTPPDSAAQRSSEGVSATTC